MGEAILPMLGREVSATPTGWGLVVGGLVVAVIGGFLVFQAWAVQSDGPGNQRWSGASGMFGYMSVIGGCMVVVGVVTVDIGLVERHLGWVAALATAGLAAYLLPRLRRSRRADQSPEARD